MRFSRVLTVISNVSVTMLCALLGVALLAVPTAAATGVPALLYDYQFVGTTGTIVNSAPSGAVPLTIFGTWQSVPQGVQFNGDTTGDASVAYGKPASGYTLDEPARAAVGFGTEFVYQAPTDGTCFGDTPNITQIGRYSAYSAQAKIQLSSCHTNENSVMAECRFAGSLTDATVPPVVSTLPLITGDTYIVTCVKSPDQLNATATIKLSVTNLDAPQGEQTVVNTFIVGALGHMRTTEYLSAGNKYPLPQSANNTDQFVGIITSAIYCAGRPRAVNACLNTNLPTS